MEMEHTDCSETGQPSEFIFPPKKATPRRGDSTAQLLNEIRIDNNRNKPEATGCCPLGNGDGGGGGRVGQSGVGWLLAWLVPLADAPLKTEEAYSTRHQVAVAVAGAFVRFSCCSCYVPEGCRTFSALRTRWGLSLWTSTSTTIPTTHLKLCAGMRHGTRWQTAKPNRTEPQKEQQHHLYGLLCLCLIGKVWWSLWWFAYLYSMNKSNSTTWQTLHPIS